MLQPSDALGISAEVAVALTGFTGVVAVFGIGAVHDWNESDRFRLRLLLTSSIMPLGLSLLGLLLMTTTLTEELIWPLCSGVALAVYMATGIRNLRMFRSIGVARMNTMPGSNILFLTSSLIGGALCLFQVYNMIVLRTFWPLFALIVASMLISLVQFVRLLSITPRPS